MRVRAVKRSWFLAVVCLLSSVGTQPAGQEMLPFDHVQGSSWIDHIGWRPTGIDAKVSELRAKGATVTSASAAGWASTLAP